MGLVVLIHSATLCLLIGAFSPFTFNVFLKNIYFIIIINLWLCWVFIATCGLSLVAASGGYSLLWCAGFSLWWLLLLWSMASAVVARGLSSCGSRAQ